MLSHPGTHRNRLITLALWLLFYASFTLTSPPLLDDADSVHAEVSREMLLRHDWVTLYANGIRYLEKAPLLYWSMALSYRVFGVSPAAARLPLALTVLALALALESFARRAFDSSRAGLYASLITLSSFGIFIFTRITIPDAAVCLWITLAIYVYWRNTELPAPSRLLCAAFAAACALNVLTKGLIGIVFPLAIVLLHLTLLDGPRNLLRNLRALYPVTGLTVFLLIAAPWHILAGLANPTQGHPSPITFTHGHWLVPLPTDGNVHGWTWFYFVNEHLLRYLNLRVPRDYDTVPLLLFYALLFVWLMPWSAFLPHALATIPWRKSLHHLRSTSSDRSSKPPFRRRASSLLSSFAAGGGSASLPIRLESPPDAASMTASSSQGSSSGELSPRAPLPSPSSPTSSAAPFTPLESTRLLLGLWAATVMLFFSFSTRQEYYVLPALPALILLIAGWLNGEADEAATFSLGQNRLRSGQRIALTLFVLGSLAALAAAFLAITSPAPNPGVDLAVLLKQNPGDYALSFGHFLDLNRRALGAFRGPLTLTAVALFTSTLLSWRLRRDFHPHGATVSLATGAFLFLLAAHWGLRIFSPVLTSQQLAAAIEPQLKPPGSRFPDLIVINGEYEAASTLGFYLNHPTAYTPATSGSSPTPASPGTISTLCRPERSERPASLPMPATPTQYRQLGRGGEAASTPTPSTPSQNGHPERTGRAAQPEDPETGNTASAAQPSPTTNLQQTLCAELPIHILNGRSSNLWYGSFFPDAPRIFETDISIQLLWTEDRRIFLWTEPDHVPKLPGHTYLIAESGGKEILSNEPNPF